MRASRLVLAEVAVAAFLFAAAACGQNSGSPRVSDSSVAKDSAVAMSPPVVADSSSPSSSGPSLADVPEAPRSPWSAPPISATSIPRIYIDVWRVAENRSRCALLAPVALGADLADATPRKATFSGGWSVAYDLPGTRSAFGVAGSGSDPWSSDIYTDWPHNISWPDGSTAGYGPEAGTGPNWLAYVKIPGQRCLYNVWSRRGKVELEQIIESLRFVTQDSG